MRPVCTRSIHTGKNEARELAAKQLGLLRELVPAATRVAALVNPANAVATETTLRDVEQAAGAMGLHIQVVHASTSREINSAFTTLARERPDALFVGEDPFLNSRRLQLSLAAMRHAIPAIYGGREHAEAGGLMSYGSSITDAYRQRTRKQSCPPLQLIVPVKSSKGDRRWGI